MVSCYNQEEIMSTSADGTLQPGSGCRIMPFELGKKKSSSQQTDTEPTHSCLGAIDQDDFTRQIISTRMAVEHHRTESLAWFCLFRFLQVFFVVYLFCDLCVILCLKIDPSVLVILAPQGIHIFSPVLKKALQKMTYIDWERVCLCMK